MRRDKVLRFLGIAFVVGAFLGLVVGARLWRVRCRTPGTPKLAAPVFGRTSSGSGAASGGHFLHVLRTR